LTAALGLSGLAGDRRALRLGNRALGWKDRHHRHAAQHQKYRPCAVPGRRFQSEKPCHRGHSLAGFSAHTERAWTVAVPEFLRENGRYICSSVFIKKGRRCAAPLDVNRCGLGAKAEPAITSPVMALRERHGYSS
jgi:hypothetical protein